MEPQLKGLMQIGIIVRNLEEAVAEYEKMGITGWNISSLSNTTPPFTDLKFDGEELPVKGDILKTAMLTIYGVEIELIEPAADCTEYSKWLKEHGPGIHHLAFDVRDDYKTFLAQAKEMTGKDPWVRGTAINGLMDFSYVDLREKMGIIVECYQSLQPGKPILRYDKDAEVSE